MKRTINILFTGIAFIIAAVIAQEAGLQTVTGVLGLIGVVLIVAYFVIRKKSLAQDSASTKHTPQNDLKKPQIVIPVIKNETKKSSPVYRDSLEKAKAFIAALTYIQGNA